MKVKHCHACGEEIPENAKVCKHCSSSQNKLAYRISALVNPVTLAISLMSLIVSISALYFSLVMEPAAPQLEVQIDRFDETNFSFFATNVGELPTVVRDVGLTLTLQQGDGKHAVRASFVTSPTQISQGESQLFEIAYSDFLPSYSRWTNSKNESESFDSGFLRAAASLGGNLHCEVHVYFTSKRYFPSNIDGADGSVNGTCSSAMEWFARNIGPLEGTENTE